MTRLPLLLALLCLALPISSQDDKDHVFDDIDNAVKDSDAHLEKLKRDKAPSDVRAAAKQMKEDVQESRRLQAEDRIRLSADMEAQYKDYAAKLVEQRETFRKMVAGKWVDVRESTPKEWVDYDKKADSRSEVDFEGGTIKVEVLVPVEKNEDLKPQEQEKIKKLAEEKLEERAQKVLTEKSDGKTEALKDQVQTTEGKPVTEKNAEAFVKKEIAPKMVVDPKPVVAQDGKPRVKVTVEIPMVPEHMKVRVSRFAPLIKSYAKDNGLDPALVFAFIHTESAFNPMARSGAGAVGLMQIVPRTAGIEAYKFVYKEEKLITPEYLQDPENNIRLGTAYIRILGNSHYGKLKKQDNRRSLTIAAYNCGPGNVRKLILSRANPDKVSPEELHKVIAEHAPKETAAYVPRVEGRVELYRGL